MPSANKTNGAISKNARHPIRFDLNHKIKSNAAGKVQAVDFANSASK